MSYRTYDEEWAKVQDILEECTPADNFLIQSKPLTDKQILHKQAANIFLKYILVINKLTDCYDMIVHPQKRILIRKILDATVIRYLELKQDLINLMSSEHVYLDDVMEELCILPHETELKIPQCYKNERSLNFDWKKNFIKNTLMKMNTNKELSEIPLTREKAVKLIQRHERARQYRIRAECMKNIRDNKERIKKMQNEEITDIGQKSALKIQRVWRGFITRRKIKNHVVKEMLLIGMLQPDQSSIENVNIIEQLKEERRNIYTKYESEFQIALTQEEEYIKKNREHFIMEKIRDEIRDWYLTYKQQTGKFPVIPSEEMGGSSAVIKQQFLKTIDEENQQANFPSVQSLKSNNLQTEKKLSLDEEDETGFKLSNSVILSELESLNDEYKKDWKYLDESNNPEQTFIRSMVTAQKTAEIETHLRKIIDSQLRVELEDLQAALDKDEKGRRIRKPVKKKKTRHTISKKSKKKKDKDLTPERTLDSLLEELVINGIIREYPFTPLSSFKGEISYTGYNYQCQGKYMSPSLGDIRQVIRDYCILPLSSVKIHQMAPLTKSLLIAGPKGCGKSLLIHAICSEVGAVLFDLTASNIVGKYPGKTGLMMLIHLVNKVSKLLQPSIIYIDDAEKTFMKKMPKNDRTDAKRLKKDLAKIVKSIGPSDLVILIGTTNCPWECDQKLLMQAYNKAILILRPDYPSVNLIWQQLLLQYKVFNRDIDIYALCKLSDGYTIGKFYQVMQRLMTCKRTLRLEIYALKLWEILEVLSNFEPIYKEEEDAFIQWYAKTPLGRNQVKSSIFEVHTENEKHKTVKSNIIA